MPVKPPTTELGAVNDAPGINAPGWGAFYDDSHEQNHHLRFPQSIPVYEGMLADSQLEALRAAIILPQFRRQTMIDPNGAPPALVQQAAADLGLPVKGAEPNASRLIGGFSWKRHLEHVLRAPFLGFYPFEIVLDKQQRPDGSFPLRKLAPRPPRTVSEIDVAPDGGLRGMRQNLVSLSANGVTVPPMIPVDRLAVYVWDQEAGNWAGRSMLRGVHKNWLAKDELQRVDVVKHRRNGMGVPTAKATQPGVDQKQLDRAQQIAAQWRVGDMASAGMPYGVDVELKGVTGSLPDTLASIRYHDEQMARRFLAMFMQLGSTETGSRALGETMVEFFALAEDALAEWVCDVTNLHVNAKIAAWNHGTDPKTDPVPLVVSERVEDPTDDVADLVGLVTAGLVTADAELEAWVREQRGYPARPVNAPRPPAAAKPVAAASSEVEDPQVPLARDISPEEQHVDWQALALLLIATRQALVTDWKTIRARQIGQLAEQIRRARTTQDILAIRATTSQADIDTVSARLRTAALEAGQAAVAEAGLLGVTVPLPDFAVPATPPVAPTAPTPGAEPVPTPDVPGAPTPEHGSVFDKTDAHARTTAEIVTDGLSEAARREAARHIDGVTQASEIADRVEGFLTGLTDSFLEEQFGGAATAAVNQARFEVMDGYPPGTRFEASELLDTNTCGPCSELDGTLFVDLAAARRMYPVAGYTQCAGRLRCRGTLVAVSPTEVPASVA